MSEMTRQERLETVFAGGAPDRTPVLGGWISSDAILAAAAGVSVDEFWEAPAETALSAYDRLGTDGLISLTIPASREDFRIVDRDSYAKADKGMSFEEALEYVDALPEPERIADGFDFDAEYEKLKGELVGGRERAGSMLWMPARWEMGARVTWYFDIGYENFFVLFGLHEDRARKLVEVGGERGRCSARLLARAMGEGLYPKAVLCGEDICTQRGPMISPAWLEKHWQPCLRSGLEPLLEAGCRVVWHCDGDVRPLLDMLTEAGVGGFQGFQPECGLTIDLMASRRTRDGGRPLIFGPLSVTTELPVLTPEEIKRKVRHAIEVCRGQADLCLFTANTINPDVPPENVFAMYEAVRE